MCGVMAVQALPYASYIQLAVEHALFQRSAIDEEPRGKERQKNDNARM